MCQFFQFCIQLFHAVVGHRHQRWRQIAQQGIEDLLPFLFDFGNHALYFCNHRFRFGFYKSRILSNFFPCPLDNFFEQFVICKKLENTFFRFRSGYAAPAMYIIYTPVVGILAGFGGCGRHPVSAGAKYQSGQQERIFLRFGAASAFRLR
nr:hypothetical protein [uncultured Victivallis sp.]